MLSNLAEMQLESRHVLRVLGYRLIQAKDNARAVEVFRKVLAMADEEPQSHRDLGLALAATGQPQEAIEHLYEVVARPWDGRFDDVELVALNELNAIIAHAARSRSTPRSSTRACCATCRSTCARCSPGTATTATWTCGSPTPTASAATTAIR